MKRSTRCAWMAVSLLVAGISVVVSDEAKPKESLAQYLETLQTKLDHAARRANQPSAEGSSVVGLRGSKQEPASKQLYWKGKRGKTAVTPEEVKSFRSAVELARQGNKTEAQAALKTFQETYPQSPLLSDAQETAKRLSE